MKCEISFWVTGPCGECGAYQDGNPESQGHITDIGLRCSKCCSVHKKSEIDWSTRKPVTTTGEQDKLF